MSSNKGPFDLIKQWLSKDSEHRPTEKKKNMKLQYFLILLLFGVAFMLISDLWSSNEDQTLQVASVESSENQSNQDEDVPTFGSNKSDINEGMRVYENQYENQLKEALDQIVGVSEVTVVVNVESTEAKIFEKNHSTQKQTTNETDTEGGKRKIEDQTTDEQIVITQDGEKEVPVISQTNKPKVSGVLVVAKGADNIQIKKWIIEAVTRALDVPSHRVAVMPKK